MGRWSRNSVELWLIAFAKSDPRSRTPGGAEPGAWCALYLPVHPMRPQAQHWLLTWAWSQARAESWREVCRQRGWSRATAERWRLWAIDCIVEGLNRLEDRDDSAAA